LTPIRRQYLDIKRRYPHAIVFFRLGDFYETFDDDAKLVARELEITLTSKPMGKGERVPLAGVPYHALDGYLARLIAKGYKVAICEQLSDPATSKGLVDREVVRVVTPGTVVEGSLLDERANNYVVAVAPPAGVRLSRTRGRDNRKGNGHGRHLAADDTQLGLAYADVSTGEFVAGQVAQAALPAELARLRPAELLLPESFEPPPGVESTVTPLDADWLLPEVAESALRSHFAIASSEAFGLGGQPLAIAAAGALLAYLLENQRSSLQHVARVQPYLPDGFVAIDAASRRNLELFAGGRDGRREHSLLGVLDLTKTSMGARLVRRRIGQPVVDITVLGARLDQVQHFADSALRRGRAQKLLSKVPDLERLVGRAVAGMISPRDLVGLRGGLELTPELRRAASEEGAPAATEELTSRLRPCDDVVAAIAQAIADEPGATLEAGNVVRPGFSQELDSLRAISRDTKRYLAELEAAERQRTTIKSLRVGYNKVFGYYIEVSKPNISLVPADYERRQTLVGGERYVTPQLKEYETRLLTAKERITEIEEQVFRQVCAQVAAASAQVLALAAAVAELDVAVALAEAAARYGYTRPELHDGDAIEIKDGRHPVVERTLSESTFVPNDTSLSHEAQIVILTGPNMAGKSTYLRQVALIALMAQAGSFVPASSARIGLVDRVFTRVGAQDDLASGQSTFLIEMLETANILHNATPRSLVILDEIGRGTSTYDGMAIARAVVEYLHGRADVCAKTLFATHYHELTELAESLPRVRNEHAAVVEEEGRIVFLHKVLAGGADRSYGVHVAELAGLPKPVVDRAREVLAALENGSNHRTASRRPAGVPAEQLSLLAPPRSPLLDDLAALDIDAMTPLEALSKLAELREAARSSAQA
jgi:DNA mismatch repair protein MutS